MGATTMGRKWDTLADLTGEDVIDSRDLVELLDELHGERDAWVENEGGDEDEQARTAEQWAEEFPDEAELVKALEGIEENAPADWLHGETFIRDSYFENYARELADDIGAIDAKAGWPNNCIDWERAADELRTDYTSYELGDVTYWARS